MCITGRKKKTLPNTPEKKKSLLPDYSEKPEKETP